jgi:hypothetical protein
LSGVIEPSGLDQDFVSTEAMFFLHSDLTSIDLPLSYSIPDLVGALHEITDFEGR